MKTTGQLIREARNAKGLSQKELAERLGVSQARIGQYENDSGSMRINTVMSIAKALNVPYIDLMTETDMVISAIDAICRDSSKEFNINPEDIFNDLEIMMLEAFDLLNQEGQKIAIERIKELSSIPKYQKK